MTRLTRRDLERALAAARSPLSLNGADLLGVDLSGLDLGGADLAYAHLEDANLTGLICAGRCCSVPKPRGLICVERICATPTSLRQTSPTAISRRLASKARTLREPI
jgi:uncharacterized protein YjbI with pentapeptide repeats